MSTDAPTDLSTWSPPPPPQNPYLAVFEAFVGTGEQDLTDPGAAWPNTVTVDAAVGYDPAGDLPDTHSAGYADVGQVRHLVEIDTNYKPGRQSEHPVQLTRVDAVGLAAAILRAVEGTFDFNRAGCLRRVEGIEVLDALGELDAVLAEVRGHAVGDIAGDIDEFWQRGPAPLRHPNEAGGS
jgi:hypothetical protein